MEAVLLPAGEAAARILGSPLGRVCSWDRCGSGMQTLPASVLQPHEGFSCAADTLSPHLETAVP